MESIASLLGALSRYLKMVGLSAVVAVITGCASTTQPSPSSAVSSEKEIAQPVDDTDVVETETVEEVIESVPTLDFTPELMYYILVAEVAGQRGDIATAIESYHRAAEILDSVTVAGRSAQVALLSRNEGLIMRALERWKAVDPEEMDVYILEVPFLMLRKQINETVEAINKALQLAPEDKLETMVRVSESLAEVADPQTALDVISQLDWYKSGDSVVLLTYARLAFFLQQYPAVLATVDPLLEQEPDNQDYLVLKSDTLQRMGRGDEALALIKQEATRKQASENIRFTYAKLLGEAGRMDEAKLIFEAIQTENPANQDVLYALGLLALEDNDPQAAKGYFRQLLQGNNGAHQAHYFMGVAEEMAGNIDAALVWYASVPMQSSRFDTAQTQYIDLLIKQGKLDKALDHLAMLRVQRPNQALQYALYEASLLHEHDRTQEAFDYLDKLVKQYPDNQEVRYHRAMIAESMDKLDVLESDLRWILDKDPNNAQALNALGYTLTDRTDRHEEALVMIQKALELKPGDPFYLDSLGWAYYRLGKLDKAEQYLREALAVQSDVEFIAHLGEVLWEQGEHDEAKSVWQQGLEQEADNELLLETMRRYGQ
jgi:tetratricopeptide (TPR) repeat protein